MNCSNLCFYLSFRNWRWLLTCRQNTMCRIFQRTAYRMCIHLYIQAFTHAAPRFAMQMYDLQVQYWLFCAQEE